MNCKHYDGELTALHPRAAEERFLSREVIVCECGVAMASVWKRVVGFNPITNIRPRAAAVRELAKAYNLRVVTDGRILRAYPRGASK